MNYGRVDANGSRYQFYENKVMHNLSQSDEYNLVVRWYPPYSNNYKKQPVSSMIEAQKMVDWFRSINVSAEIVTINKIEVIELY